MMRIHTIKKTTLGWRKPIKNASQKKRVVKQKRKTTKSKQFAINPFWKFQNSSEFPLYNLCVCVLGAMLKIIHWKIQRARCIIFIVI